MRVDDNRRVEIGEGDHQHCQCEIVPESLNVRERALQSGDQHRDEHQRLREDDGHDVCRIHLQRDVLTYAAVLLVTDNTLGILYRHLADGLHHSYRDHEHKEQDHKLHHEHDQATRRGAHTGRELGQQSLRQTCHDTDHDDERDSVADTLVGDLLAEPHREHRTCDEDDGGVGEE